MKKSLKVLLTLFATAVVLVGCSVESGGGGTTPPPIRVTATGDGAPLPLATVTQNQNRRIEVTVPGNLGDLVVFEAEGPGTKSVVVRDATGAIIGGSSSPHYFVPADAIGTLGDFSPEFNTEAVGVNLSCIGPCVIVEGSNSPTKYFVEVRTNGSSDFLAYASDYGDQGEPGNNSTTGSQNLSSGDVVLGAFETLNDVDHYWILDNTQVIIEPTGSGYNEGLQLIVETSDSTTNWAFTEVLPDQNGKFTTTVFSDTDIRIRTVSGHGGDFASSSYRISVN